MLAATPGPRPLAPIAAWLYALGSLGGNALFQSYSLWLIYFYAPPAGRGLPTFVPITTLGFILGLTQLIGLVNGPAIGYLSDRTRSRLGRRGPYVLFGSPFLALSFFLLWTPPEPEPGSLNAVYLFMVALLFLLGYTTVMGPYDALLPEIARTSSQRVTLASLKVVTGTVGGAIGLVASGGLIEAAGFRGMAVAMAAVALASFALALVGIRSAGEEARPSALSFFLSLAATFRNQAFLALVLSLGFLLLGQNLLVQLIPYFTTVVLGAPEGGVSLLTGALMTAVILSLPVLSRLSRRWGKKPVASGATLALGLYLPTLGLVGLAEEPRLALGVLAVGVLGIAVAALYVFPIALLADVVDDDALRTGERREAIYFGVSASLTKLAFVLSSWLFGGILGVFGFSLENPVGIYLIPAVAGACVLIGWAVLQWGYRLPDTVGASDG